MGTAGGGHHHRRTLSNVSSNSSSNVNPVFRMETEEIASIYPYTATLHCAAGSGYNALNHNRMRVYENIPYKPTGPSGFPQSNCGNPQLDWMSASPPAPLHLPPPVPAERPMTLSFEHAGGTKLRSSLKKYNTGRRGSSASACGADGSGGGSCVGTPTKPTPPDSLTSDDSSYMSAKDGYSSLSSSQSRVRFSPETLLDQPVQGQNMDVTIPIQAVRRLSRRHMSTGGGAGLGGSGSGDGGTTSS